MPTRAVSHDPLSPTGHLFCIRLWHLVAVVGATVAAGIRGGRVLPVLPFHHALGALGPITAAFLVSAMETGLAGPLDLFRRMGLWRGRFAWVAVALFVPLALLALAAVGTSLVGGESLSLTGFGRSREFPQFSALGFLAYNIVSFEYGEEVGWRGFALPRLQSRHSAFVATVLLTLGWALWHLPLFFYRPGYMVMGAADVVGWFLSFLTGAALLTLLYNESRGSLLVVALFHAAVDIVFTSDISSQSVTNAAGALITFWGIIVLVAAGPAYLSWRGKMIRLYEDAAVTGSIDRYDHITQTDR